MFLKKFICVLGILTALSAHSQESRQGEDFENSLQSIDITEHPAVRADKVILFTPHKSYALNVPSKSAVYLEGKIEGGAEAREVIRILIPAGSMIRPLQENKTVRMFLLKYNEDIYIPSAIVNPEVSPEANSQKTRPVEVGIGFTKHNRGPGWSPRTRSAILSIV